MDVKIGQESRGLFAIIYGPGGVRWVRGQRAAEIAYLVLREQGALTTDKGDHR